MRKALIGFVLLLTTGAAAQEMPTLNITALCQDGIDSHNESVASKDRLSPELNKAALTLCEARQNEQRHKLTELWNDTATDIKAACIIRTLVHDLGYAGLAECIEKQQGPGIDLNPQWREAFYNYPGGIVRVPVRDFAECYELIRRASGIGVCSN